MTKRFERDLRSAVWPATPAQLAALGVTRAQWRGRAWRSTGRGLFVPSDVTVTPAQRIVQVAPLVPVGGAITGWAAAHMHGVDLLDGLDHETMAPLPVPACLNNPAGRRDQATVTYYRDRLALGEATLRYGIPITSPLRCVVDGIRHALNLVEAVAFLDLVSHSLELDPAAVEAWCAAHPGERGVRLLRAAVRWCDPRSANAWETRLRMFYRRTTALPRPEVNQPVFDLEERFLGTPDLLDEEAGLATEFDGQEHRERQQHRRDNLREEMLEEANLVVCRVDSLDLRQPVPLRERLRAAYARGRSRDRKRDRFTTQVPDWWLRRRRAS